MVSKLLVDRPFVNSRDAYTNLLELGNEITTNVLTECVNSLGPAKDEGTTTRKRKRYHDYKHQ